MKDIIIKGGYGLRNFGDDALMYYLIKVIQQEYPEFSIGLVCENSLYIKDWFPEVDFVQNTDKPKSILMYGGGTLYYSFDKKNNFKLFISRVSKVIRNPSVVKKLFFKHRKLNTSLNYPPFKTVMFGLGFGPFYKKNNKYHKAISDVLNADIVCVRDSVSYDFVSKYTNQAFLGTDICFSKNVIINESRAAKKNRNNKKVAVVVRDWKNGTSEDNYRETLVRNVQLLRNKGYQVTYVIFSDLRDVDWLSFLQSIDEVVLMWEPNTQKIDCFMDQLSVFDIIISARFHGIIFSNLLCIPSISVAIEPKLELAVENSACLVWKPSLDLEGCQLLELVREIEKNYDARVQKCLDINREKSQSFENMLKFALK